MMNFVKTTARGVVFGLLCALSSGCCGSLKVDRDSLDLPVVTRALDSAHEILAARGENVLYAGAATVDITTRIGREGGLYLGGFDMGRRNTGVRDPIYAHVLYLDDGSELLVLVSIDTIGLDNDQVRDVRALASERHRNRIIITATHNHAGPDTIGLWGPACMGLPLCPGLVPEYMETLKYLIASGIDRAVQTAEPSRIRFAKGPVDRGLSINIHPEIRMQKDDVVRVMALESVEDGRNIAVVANWGCHAEAMWNDDLLSADWPGEFYRRWEAARGGVPLFVQHALGGLVSVNPGAGKLALESEIMDVFLEHVTVEERLGIAERIGKGLFEAVEAALEGSEDVYGPEGVTFSILTEDLKLRVDNWIFDYLGRRKLLQRQIVKRNRKPYMKTDILVARFRNGDEVLADLVTVPGEPSSPLVEVLDATSDAPVRFTVSLGNDEIGYIVREEDWELESYSYERTMSLGKETGTVILETIRELRDWL